MVFSILKIVSSKIQNDCLSVLCKNSTFFRIKTHVSWRKTDQHVPLPPPTCFKTFIFVFNAVDSKGAKKKNLLELHTTDWLGWMPAQEMQLKPGVSVTWNSGM